MSHERPGIGHNGPPPDEPEHCGDIGCNEGDRIISNQPRLANGRFGFKVAIVSGCIICAILAAGGSAPRAF